MSDETIYEIFAEDERHSGDVRGAMLMGDDFAERQRRFLEVRMVLEAQWDAEPVTFLEVFTGSGAQRFAPGSRRA